MRFVRQELLTTAVLNLISHLEKITHRRCDHADTRVREALQNGDQTREEACKMVDLGKTQESVANDKVEVGKTEIVVVLAIESISDDIGGQSTKSTIKTEDLVVVQMLLESSQKLGNTLMDERLEVGDGSLREVRVQVAATRTMMVMIDSGGSGGGNVKSTDSGGVLVGLARTSSIDGSVVG